MVALVLAACGDVKGGEIDARVTPDTPTDMGPSCAGDTVAACGATCATCTATSDREVPTCTSGACGTACMASSPRCSDATCSRLEWHFSSGQVDGIAAVQPASQVVAVRNFNGEQALALDVSALPPEVRITVPVCLSGVVDVNALTLSYRVFFQGGTLQNENYYTQAAVPSPQTSAYIAQKGVQAGLWVPFSGPMSASQFSATTSQITIQLGTYGAAFAGTIWVDDIVIQ